MVDKTGSGSPKTTLKELRRLWGRFWHFFWEEDTFLSWVINIVVAFMLIKWVIYPSLGLIFQTSHPVVAVISNSMDHEGGFDQWWQNKGQWYEKAGIAEADFMDYDFTNGFNRGDIMLLRGVSPSGLGRGDVIVYQSYIRNEPIIHRIVNIEGSNAFYFYTTKGDRNDMSFPFEQRIEQDNMIGKAFFRLRYLGWIKISFVCMVDMVKGKNGFINCMRG